MRYKTLLRNVDMVDVSKLNELLELREKVEQDLKEEYLRIFQELYKIQIGSVVKCTETQKLYRVIDIETDDPIEFKPWVKGQYIREDGFQTKKTKYLHRQWELVK